VEEEEAAAAAGGGGGGGGGAMFNNKKRLQIKSQSTTSYSSKLQKGIANQVRINSRRKRATAATTRSNCANQRISKRRRRCSKHD
jgi:hypothetical protein